MAIIIISVLLFVIGGFIVLAIVLQLKEQARLDKIRKVAALNNHLRQVRRYIDEMPSQYQPKDMRLWLFSRLASLYDALLEVTPDPTLSRRRKALTAEIAESQGNQKKRRSKPINDELMIINLKKLFESFHSFLKQSEKDKTLSSDVAARYINLLQVYKYQIDSDYHSYLARQSFLSGSYEKSIETYKVALAKLSPVKNKPEAAEAITQLNSLIKQIESALAMSKTGSAEGLVGGHELQSEAGELNEEWDKFIDVTEFKKKKHF